MGQIFFRMIVGGLAGLVAWAIWEPQFPTSSDAIAATGRWAFVERMLNLTMGACIGMSLGALGGWMQGSRRHLFRGFGIGLLLGVVGAYLGYLIGGGLLASYLQAIRFPSWPEFFTFDTPVGTRMVGRTLAMIPVGLLIGSAIGASGLTARRFMVGAIGGLLGGAAAGILFDPISQAVAPVVLDLRGGTQTIQDGIPKVTGEVGIVARALMALSIGAFVGLFIGIVDRVTRTAWIRLVLGRNEGKEWVVDAQQTFLGRSEGAHVPLFGDPNVAPMHACIVRQGQAYMLMDGGSALGTGLNGQRVQQSPLYDGAQIQIGSHLLLFQLRQGSAPQRAAEALRAQHYVPQAQGQAVVAPYGPAAAYAPAQPTVPAAPAQPAAAPAPAPGMPSPGQQTVAVPAASAPAMPGYALVATDGPLLGQRFEVRSPTEIGRESAGIRLGFDSSASRRHASLVPSADGLNVTDLGSTNGTFVNGQKAQTATARPGDTLKIGATTFRVEQA